MVSRRVTQTAKDKDGDILALCNPASDWKRVTKATAIKEIDNRTHSYYVQWTATERTGIHVAGPAGNRYLRTDRDDTTRNNLRDLPPC